MSYNELYKLAEKVKKEETKTNLTYEFCKKKQDKYKSKYDQIIRIGNNKGVGYNSEFKKIALIKGLSKVSNKVRGVGACKSIRKINSKRLAKCLSRKRSGKSVSSECENRFRIINDKFKTCIDKSYSSSIKSVAYRVNSILGGMLGLDKHNTFKIIQCELFSIIKILLIHGISHQEILKLFIEKSKKNDNISEYYPRIFYETIMNNDMYKQNLGRIFFSIKTLRKNVVMTFIETLEDLGKQLEKKSIR